MTRRQRRQGRPGAAGDRLAGANEAVQLDLLKGAREGLRGRKSMKMPAGWPALYAVAWPEATTPAIREHSMHPGPGLRRSAGAGRPSQDGRDASRADRRALAALEALIEKHPPDLVPVLHDLLADKNVRRLALRGLGSVRRHEPRPKRVLAVYPRLTTEEKQDAIATLASRKEYALALLAGGGEEDRGPHGRCVRLHRRASSMPWATRKSANGCARSGAKCATPRRKSGSNWRHYKALLTPAFMKNADRSNGRLVFSKTCQQCHKLFGEGGTIGPDLTGYNRAQLDYLLVKIVDPNAQVAKDYHMSIVTTEDGRVITGIIVEALRPASSCKRPRSGIVLAKEDVETIKDSRPSIMPEGQLDALTKKQVRDLIAYLSGKTQVPLPPRSPDGK